MAIESFMVERGTPAPHFDLPNANPSAGGDRYGLEDATEARVLVVVFSCNHCPYVKHIEPALVALAREYDPADVVFVAINSNDAAQYPDDDFESMTTRAEERGFPFPYLFDESQDVARAYRAACTPDFFVYNGERKLTYRGRFDETRPGGQAAHGTELRAAIDGLLVGRDAPDEQWPSIGCSIKWRA